MQEVGESTPKAGAASPSSTFARRPSAAMSELEPLAEVEGEGEGGASEDPDAPQKGGSSASHAVSPCMQRTQMGRAVSYLIPRACRKGSGILARDNCQLHHHRCCFATRASCIMRLVMLLRRGCIEQCSVSACRGSKEGTGRGREES